MQVRTPVTIELLHDLLTSTRDLTDTLIINNNTTINNTTINNTTKDILQELYNWLELLIDNFETDLLNNWIETKDFYDNPNNCNRILS